MNSETGIASTTCASTDADDDFAATGSNDGDDAGAEIEYGLPPPLPPTPPPPDTKEPPDHPEVLGVAVTGAAMGPTVLQWHVRMQISDSSAEAVPPRSSHMPVVAFLVNTAAFFPEAEGLTASGRHSVGAQALVHVGKSDLLAQNS